MWLLHAYVNPSHERRLAEMLQRDFPDLEVSLSCDVLPEIKEFERASTTAANAFVGPIVRHYVDALEQRTQALGMPRGVRIMQSNGGVMTAQTAVRRGSRFRTMLSGTRRRRTRGSPAGPRGRRRQYAEHRHGRDQLRHVPDLPRPDPLHQGR